MDMQAMINAVSRACAEARSGYHLTLGALIGALEKAPPGARIAFSHDAMFGPGFPHSYRGYYEDLAFEPMPPPTVAEFLPKCREALGKTFGGYKGGDYTMSDTTPLWCAEYGHCGLAIVGHYDGGDVQVLMTRDLDADPS
jgi:hypothetical protein